MPSTQPLLPDFPEILYGGDYNPEQWPENVWPEDMRLMSRAGVNLVSIGIFSWAKLQPDENTYTFDWLDRLMNLLADHGIRADLATATASPPPWMSRYPDLAAVDADGHVFTHGSRQHYSSSSPTYKKYAAALVRKLAQRYAKHPALAAWHINNEYACHVAACHSETSAAAFREWLKKRYSTLDALNAAWSTAFWSQTYNAWDDIQTPRRTPTFTNPTQTLDFHRFSSDALLDLCRMEKEILREITPHIPVTTNFMGFFKPLDYHAWARELDFTSWDSYPDILLPGNAPHLAAVQGHDLTRSLKPNRPFVLMEHVTSHVHWRPINATKLPGMIRLHGLQAVARGADGVLFFQWRQSLGGAEKFHGSVLQHGVPPGEGRVFREVCELGADLKKLQPITGSLVRSRVAIVIDWHAWWALEIPGKPTTFDYSATLANFHRYFYERNIAVDFIAPSASFANYALVIAPLLYLLEKENAENLTSYVSEGGTLLTTCFSGIVDANDRVIPGGYPALLRQTLGLWVEEWFPLGAEEHRTVKFTADANAPAISGKIWNEVVHTETADTLATFDEGHLKNRPAFTRNTCGKGRAYYLGTLPDQAGIDITLDKVCTGLALNAPVSAPRGVEVSLRENKTTQKRYLFLLNYTAETVLIPLANHSGRDLLSGETATDTWTLPPSGVAVIESTLI